MPINLDELNQQQRLAVSTLNGPLLVLAGAGSGKTKVLTYRIAHILESELCNPWNVLAITFTNKAATEMKLRISSLIGPKSKGMWVLTFHSMCVRILRANASSVGFTENFTIYDDTDCKRLIKVICADLNINTKMYSENMIRSRISSAKNELISPKAYAENADDLISQITSDVYYEYQKRLHAANSFDFDDLLMYTYYLFVRNPQILQLYYDRFKYILVDEYQDTNKVQYEICRLLAGKRSNIMVVGDDDQSIYSWRGADIRNILEFENDYPNTTIVKLEQNYRSTSNILNAANSVISNNSRRKRKTLFTNSDNGEKIGVYVASNERDEGRWIAGEIERRRLRGAKLTDIAVFYRINAQSRILEDMMIRAGIPYKIVGGLKFFERAEIKDIMSYLTLLINPNDDISARRVVNMPRRGIGKTAIEQINDIAKMDNISFYDACMKVVEENTARPTLINGLKIFINCVETAKEKLENSTFSNNADSDLKKEIALSRINNGDSYADIRYFIEDYIKSTGYIEMLKAEHTAEADGRVDNINEFFGVIDEFVQTHQSADTLYDAPSENNANNDQNDMVTKSLDGNSLPDFLEWVRLRTDLDNLGSIDDENSDSADNNDCITMMSIHASKGLEFDYVFVTGMEEGVFPHVISFSDANDIEEERRLAYVAITRARKELLLTCAQLRQLRGQTNANAVSRFIGEIPNEFKKSYGVGSLEYSGFGWEKRGDRKGIAGSGVSAGNNGGFIDFFGDGKKTSKNWNKSSRDSKLKKLNYSTSNNATYEVGDTIRHKVFGVGKITKINGDRLHVTFTQSNQSKILMKNFAPIVKID